MNRIIAHFCIIRVISIKAVNHEIALGHHEAEEKCGQAGNQGLNITH